MKTLILLMNNNFFALQYYIIILRLATQNSYLRKEEQLSKIFVYITVFS